ncbi:MAG: hypothetical protein JST68_16210, partial [Bacteroidetes bacterium]|nr:hypothetical protein [Bacteroidota bacterium]
MTNHISKIDTQRFGFDIARIDDSQTLLQPGFLQELERHGVRLVITRIPTEKTDQINALEDMGFRVKDVQITYRLALNEFVPSQNHQDFQ